MAHGNRQWEELGSTWGQARVGPGGTWGRARVELGSTRESVAQENCPWIPGRQDSLFQTLPQGDDSLHPGGQRLARDMTPSQAFCEWPWSLSNFSHSLYRPAFPQMQLQVSPRKTSSPVISLHQLCPTLSLPLTQPPPHPASPKSPPHPASISPSLTQPPPHSAAPKPPASGPPTPMLPGRLAHSLETCFPYWHIRVV